MVKSLTDLCTAVCLRNIKDIDNMGGVRFSLVRKIILKIDNPVQLRRVEINSPHFGEDTEECWRRLITRDFPVLSERYRFVPKNIKSWHKIYAKYHHLDVETKRAADEKLKNAYKDLKKEKEQTVSRVINYDSRILPGLPRDVKPQVGVRPKGWRNTPDQSELRFTGGSRTKTNTPKSLLKRAMREAKEITSRNRLNTAAGVGPARVKPGQLQKAPTGMVQEKINNARPLRGIRPPASIPRKRETEDREARLRKAKRMDSQKGASYLADDDLDDMDFEDEDGPVGLDIEDLEALADHSASRTRPGPAGSGKGSAFARTMGSSSAAPSTSAAHPDARAKQASSKSSTQPMGPSSPPQKAAPMLPRKRKAVDVFMKPKPKMSRS